MSDTTDTVSVRVKRTWEITETVTLRIPRADWEENDFDHDAYVERLAQEADARGEFSDPSFDEMLSDSWDVVDD